jgi:hypothetical protein
LPLGDDLGTASGLTARDRAFKAWLRDRMPCTSSRGPVITMNVVSAVDAPSSFHTSSMMEALAAILGNVIGLGKPRLSSRSRRNGRTRQPVLETKTLNASPSPYIDEAEYLVGRPRRAERLQDVMPALMPPQDLCVFEQELRFRSVASTDP